jgi:hypothetical protein
MYLMNCVVVLGAGQMGEKGPREHKCAAVQMGGSLAPVRKLYSGPAFLRPPTESSIHSTDYQSVTFHSIGTGRVFRV